MMTEHYTHPPTPEVRHPDETGYEIASYLALFRAMAIVGNTEAYGFSHFRMCRLVSNGDFDTILENSRDQSGRRNGSLEEQQYMSTYNPLRNNDGVVHAAITAIRVAQKDEMALETAAMHGLPKVSDYIETIGDFYGEQTAKLVTTLDCNGKPIFVNPEYLTGLVKIMKRDIQTYYEEDQATEAA